MLKEKTGNNFHCKSLQVFLISLHWRMFLIYIRNLSFLWTTEISGQELGPAIQYLFHDQHVNGQNDDRGSMMMMSGLPVDNQSRHWKLICSQAQQFPKADIYPSQDIIKEIIDEHILFTHILDKCGRLSISRGSRSGSRIRCSGAGTTCVQCWGRPWPCQLHWQDDQNS